MKKLISKTEKSQYEYLIRALSAAVNKRVPPLPGDNLNWDRLISIAKSCSVEAAFANAVLSVGNLSFLSENVIKELNTIKSKGIFIDSVREFEIKKILQKFDDNRIKNVPLKGYFLKGEYPRTDFRSICDYDILFDEKDLPKVRAIFEELGYKYIKKDDTQHHFVKQPNMYVEMHSSLVHLDNRYYPFLKDKLNQSFKTGEYSHSYNMSLEDFYIFMLVHSSNHFISGGMGIRMVLDIYVFYQNHREEFDYEYLSKTLSKMKLDKFEDKVRKIAFKWFSVEPDLSEFSDTEVYILLSNTLGRLSVSVMSESEKIGSEERSKRNRLAYLLSSIFKPLNSLKYTYTYLKKYPFLLPIAWLSFWCNRIFIKKDVSIKRGLQNRLNYTSEDVDYFNNILNEVGLK